MITVCLAAAGGGRFLFFPFSVEKLYINGARFFNGCLFVCFFSVFHFSRAPSFLRSALDGCAIVGVCSNLAYDLYMLSERRREIATKIDGIQKWNVMEKIEEKSAIAKCFSFKLFVIFFCSLSPLLSFSCFVPLFSLCFFRVFYSLGCLFAHFNFYLILFVYAEFHEWLIIQTDSSPLIWVEEMPRDLYKYSLD